MQVEIGHIDNGKTGRFFVNKDGKDVAEMTYTWKGAHINIDHTLVDEQLKGNNIGGQLVEAAVNWAREKHFKISATCSFARAVFAKKAEYSDVYIN